MGTNFYIAEDHTDGMDPEWHIGKRSAAGRFCWDCRVTLSTTGTPHDSAPFHEQCPQCGRGPDSESLEQGAAGRELGFNKSEPAPKTGIRSASSFTWAMDQSRLEGVDEIVDEYGTRYTRAEFTAVLSECPIQFTDSIGTWF